MANVVLNDRQTAIIAALAEGSASAPLNPAVSPETAVRVAIMQELRDAETA